MFGFNIEEKIIISGCSSMDEQWSSKPFDVGSTPTSQTNF